MKRSIVRLGLIGTGALAVAGPAFAQTAAVDQPAVDPGDIIVTARRSEERLQDVPISITVVTQAELSKRNISNIGDLGTYVPSLATNSRFGAEKSSFSIRGFTQEFKTSPSVGVYFADVVGLRANSGTAAGNGAGVGELFDLQNIQVLKGPQGTLFGRNTTGGAVLLVPNKPVDRFEGYVEGSLGNYDMRRLQGVINVPLSDTFFVRAGIDLQKRDGYLKNKSGIGPDALADVDYIAARFSARWEPTATLANDFIASFTRSNNNGSVPRVQICNRALAATPAGFIAALGCAQLDRQAARGDGFYDVENGLADPRIETRQWRAINTTTWQATDNLTVKNIVSYGEFRERNGYSVFGDNVSLAPGVQLPLLTITPGSTGVTADQSTFTEELQLQGATSDGRFKWVAGGYAEISRPLGFNSQYVQLLLNCADVNKLQCVDLIGAGNLTLQQIKDYFDDYGVYAQGTYKLTDTFSLTGGLRYTWDRIRSEGQNLVIRFPTPNNPVYTCQNLLQFDADPSPNGFAPVVVDGPSRCNVKYKTSSERATWLISAEYEPSANQLLYAKWSRGYRAGGINSLILGLETWGPEKVDTYEIGSKTSFRGALSGYINVAAFYNDFVNQQLSANLVPDPKLNGLTPQQGVVNAGKSRIFGVEVDASVTPFAGFRVDLGYAYLNTKLKSIDVASSSPLYALILPNALEGDSLALSPKHRATLSGNYTLPLDASIGSVSVGATYVYTDKQNSVSPLSSPLYRIRSTDLVNLNAAWTSILGKPIDASFFVTNLTKVKSRVFAASGYPFFGFDGVVTNQPRMYGVRLRYHFGG